MPSLNKMLADRAALKAHREAIQQRPIRNPGDAADLYRLESQIQEINRELARARGFKSKAGMVAA